MEYVQRYEVLTLKMQMIAEASWLVSYAQIHQDLNFFILNEYAMALPTITLIKATRSEKALIQH